MRITRLVVENFKSIGPAVELADLGAVNVLHGPNNAGKSNILDAIGVAFRVLGALPECWESLVEANTISEERWSAILGESSGIWALNRWHVESPLGDSFRISLALASPDAVLEFSLRFGDRSLHVHTLRWGDQDFNALARDVDEPDVDAVERFVRQLSSVADVAVRSFACQALPGSLAALAAHLILHKDAIEPRARMAWRRLVSAFDAYAPEVEGMQLSTATRGGEAVLVLEQREEPFAVVHLEEQGQGVQAVIWALSALLFSGADIVVLEEPESNLSLSGQLRLRDLILKIAQERGLQVFITSHTFAFDRGPVLWSVEKQQGYTVVGRLERSSQPSAEVTEVVERHLHALRDEQHPKLPAAWISREGLVLLPEDVRKQLKLDHLDILYFVPNPETGRVELWRGDEIIAGLGGKA